MKKKWGCQISIDVAKRDDMLELMARSGCISALIGFESLNKENLTEMRKGCNRAEDYQIVIEKMKKYAIMIYGSFVFGYDFDGAATLQAALAFAKKNKLFLTNFNTLNPMPETLLYKRLLKEGRLVQDDWWLDKANTYGEIMFYPKKMSREDLKNQSIRLRMEFNSLKSIFQRLFDFRNNCRTLSNIILFLAGNLVARKDITRKMKVLRSETAKGR